MQGTQVHLQDFSSTQLHCISRGLLQVPDLFQIWYISYGKLMFLVVESEYSTHYSMLANVASRI